MAGGVGLRSRLARCRRAHPLFLGGGVDGERSGAAGVLLWLGRPHAGLVFALLAALLWVKHRPNIERLLDGTETRIGQRG